MRDKSAIAELRQFLVRQMRARTDAIWRAPIRLALSLLIFTSTITPSISHADWITSGWFSPESKIDSINRFLVIQDVDSSKFLGYEMFSLGDITGDGASDILVQRWVGGSLLPGNAAFIYYGGSPPDGISDDRFDGFMPDCGIIGDVNNDGYLDIGMFPWPEYLFELYFGGPNIDSIADFSISNIVSWIPRSADLNNDGFLELALSTDLNGGPVNIYRIDDLRDTIPEYVINDTSRAFGNNLTTLDFNGDRNSDLAVAAYRNRETCFVKFYWGGA